MASVTKKAATAQIKPSVEKKEEYEKESILEKLTELSGGDLKKVIDEFIKLIYDNTRCIGGIHKGVLYKELPNAWSTRKHFTDSEKKYECTGTDYDDCSVSDEINKSVKGKVKLIWGFDKIKTDKTASFDIDKERFPILDQPQVLGYMKTLPSKKSDIFFKGKLTINSQAQDTEDHRGSNHCLIQLPISTYIELENPTFNDFVRSLYLSKMKKFDTWYELYCGCRVVVKNDGIVITTEFDNGS